MLTNYLKAKKLVISLDRFLKKREWESELTYPFNAAESRMARIGREAIGEVLRDLERYIEEASLVAGGYYPPVGGHEPERVSKREQQIAKTDLKRLQAVRSALRSLK